MTSLNDYLFGPLQKEYCMYFYLLSVLCFFSSIVVFVSMMVAVFSNPAKRTDSSFLLTMSFGVLYWIALYIQNRLLHSMCVNSEGLVSKKIQ